MELISVYHRLRNYPSNTPKAAKQLTDYGAVHNICCSTCAVCTLAYPSQLPDVKGQQSDVWCTVLLGDIRVSKHNSKPHKSALLSLLIPSNHKSQNRQAFSNTFFLPLNKTLKPGTVPFARLALGLRVSLCLSLSAVPWFSAKPYTEPQKSENLIPALFLQGLLPEESRGSINN